MYYDTDRLWQQHQVLAAEIKAWIENSIRLGIYGMRHSR
jgi:hypothetical protein